MRLWLNGPSSSFSDTVFDNNGYQLNWNSDRTLTWQVNKAPSGNVTVSSGAVPNDGGWHRVVCYLSVSNSIGIILDNGTAATASFTGGMYNAGTDFLEFLTTPGSPNPTLLVDEVAFWHDFVFSDPAALTKDWNGGSGVTYPLP